VGQAAAHRGVVGRRVWLRAVLYGLVERWDVLGERDVLKERTLYTYSGSGDLLTQDTVEVTAGNAGRVTEPLRGPLLFVLQRLARAAAKRGGAAFLLYPPPIHPLQIRITP
jgi:hypothetical protein